MDVANGFEFLNSFPEPLADEAKRAQFTLGLKMVSIELRAIRSFSD